MEIGPGYPFAQLAKAFAARDQRRIERWTDVLRGMAGGMLIPGSRTPVKDMPPLDYDDFGDVDSFGRYCLNRAPRTDSYVASNGRVIEQAQILTTHNLAALSAHVELDYAALIERACKRALRLTRDRRKFGFAWRQIVFYASFTDVRPDVEGTALQPLFAGLERGEAPFLGWR